jgi:acetoin utilization protein AcuB
MTVADAMVRDVVTLTPEQTLKDAIELLRRSRIRHLPVTDALGLVGIVTDRDVKRATPSILGGVSEAEYVQALAAIKVGQFMTKDPITVSGRSPLKAAVGILLSQRVGALPVVDNGSLVGILTESDVLRIAHDFLPD